METKRMTLKSQTVQCPHCGEYYSVTYSHCPFCSAGRREAEAEKAAKGGLFSRLGGGEKKKRPEPREEHRTEHRAEHRSERPARLERPVREEQPEERRKRPAPAAEPARKSGHHAGQRKKTSEMTPEERAANRAEREARAAERKRERDRLAREAALRATMEPPKPAAPTPVYEEVTVPETFGYTTEPEAPVQGTEPPADPVERSRWDFVQELKNAPVPPMAPVEPIADITVQTASTPAAPAAPVQTAPVQSTASAPQTAPAQQAAPVQQAAPAQPTAAAQPAAGKVESEEDLDALLREIRGMLSDSPVPPLSADQLKKPVAPPAEAVVTPVVPPIDQTETTVATAVEEELVEAAVAEEVAAPVQETAPVQEAAPVQQAAPAQQTAPVQEPTPVAAPAAEVVPAAAPMQGGAWQVPGEEPAAAPAEEAVEPPAEKPHAASYEDVVPEEATIVLPTVDELPTAAPAPRAERPEPVHHAEQQHPRPKKKQKSGRPPILAIVSLLIIIAAIVIVVRYVVPTFQNGLFSGLFSQSDTVAPESVALDQAELSLTESGATAQLTAVFAPDGSGGTVTWTTSDEAVATVDETGLVTAVAPGTATITATVGESLSATCTVTCAWTTEPPAPTGPTLSATQITLDAAGKTNQLQVTGTESAVTWSSDQPDIATVGTDGTVTAVAKGSATITATVDGQSLTCSVTCLW